MQNDWLKKWALYAPQSCAFSDADSGRSWTYGELYAIAQKVAMRLRDGFGVGRGDRVAVLATNEMEYVALFFGAQRLGAILVPINVRLAAPEIAHVLLDSGAKLLVHQTVFNFAIASARASLAASSVTAAFDLWNFDGPSSLAECVAAPGGGEGGATMQSSGSEACMILYTSGTSGAPKGALITYDMLFWNSINTTMRLNIGQNDVALSFLPFYHTGGWNVLLTPFVHRGARTVIMRKFDPGRVLELCESERVTILFGVPTTMDMMSREPNFDRVDLLSVRYAIVGGEPMPIDLIRRWQAKGIPIRQGYGLTEFGPNVFSLNEEDCLRKIGSIGFPNFYIETKIVDGHGGEIFDDGIGELALRGPVCTPGYWRNDAATKEALRDGWFFTGDLVRRDSDGYFFVAGRKKDMFISGGENVYPVEIERVLSGHPAVREVAVIGVRNAKWGEVGRAYIAVNPGSRLAAEDVANYCASRLARFKIPKEIEFLPDLPKGDSGKILKRNLSNEPR